jgi:hypothetical protein
VRCGLPVGKHRPASESKSKKDFLHSSGFASNGKVWDDVAAADLFGIARNVLRLPEEMKKPSYQR